MDAEIAEKALDKKFLTTLALGIAIKVAVVGAIVVAGHIAEKKLAKK